jgi:hypothetical protein
MSEEHSIEPVAGEVTELRISPDLLRAARPVPEQFVREGRRWLSVYFMEHVGLTVALLTDEDVQHWRTVYCDRPTTED